MASMMTWWWWMICLMTTALLIYLSSHGTASFLVSMLEEEMHGAGFSREHEKNATEPLVSHHRNLAIPFKDVLKQLKSPSSCQYWVLSVISLVSLVELVCSFLIQWSMDKRSKWTVYNLILFSLPFCLLGFQPRHKYTFPKEAAELRNNF